MGAPIYLVSACASGEEFVAAFRRYADKNGLFIPIGDPLPPGQRSRFAVTLRDGGVMIEGEAEIVSSARVPSVLHGRIGMTLRFVEPDEASRTTLSELEKARLAMKPAPPSVPPRPADIPAEPRPVPPPAQGRIDAVNALAECVVIGDVSVLGPPLPAAVAAPPKTGPRPVLPGMPPSRAPSTSPPGTLGAATIARPPATLIPVAIPRPDGRPDAEPPAVTPRATPQPDRLRSAERPAPERPVERPALESISGLSQTFTAVEVAPGPTSDTMVAVAPPAAATIPAEPSFPPEPPPLPEATGRFEKGPLSATMTAVPVPTANPPSAPTEIGGPIVVPIHADDDPSARTQIHAGAPRPPRSEPWPHPLPVTMHGVALEPRAPAPRLSPEIEIAEPTDISMPPAPPSSPSSELSVEPPPSTEPEAPVLSGRASTADEPADEDSSTEPSSVRALAGTRSAEVRIEVPIEAPVPQDSGATSGAITHQRSAEPEPEGAPGRPRRTVIGVAVQPGGVLIPPAPPRREPVAAPDEPTSILVGDPAVAAAAPTVPPGSDPLPAAEPPPRAPMPATPGAITGALPSGDWTIALDPAAPDGWSSPRHAVRRAPPAGGVPGVPTADGDGAPPHLKTPPMSPAALAASAPDAWTLRPGEVPTAEPKVQIDPTLVDPQSGLPVGPAGSPAGPPSAAS
ncbi:MAG TPA: hypothetical protein VHW23_12380, partial [Kofleriaceae bacterium]|nr:hypothetical protein [Kofleriaceae bacterium]